MDLEDGGLILIGGFEPEVRWTPVRDALAVGFLLWQTVRLEYSWSTVYSSSPTRNLVFD